MPVMKLVQQPVQFPKKIVAGTCAQQLCGTVCLFVCLSRSPYSDRCMQCRALPVTTALAGRRCIQCRSRLSMCETGAMSPATFFRDV